MEAASGALGPASVDPPTDLTGATPVDVARAVGHATLADLLHQHYYNKRTGFNANRPINYENGV